MNIRQLTLFSVLALAACSQAQDQLIARVRSLADAPAVAKRAGILLIDTASPGPFVLFRTFPGQDVHAVQAALMLDAEVVWAEDDQPVDFPERTGGGKGSTIAAIADRDALYTENSSLLSQINWSRPRSLAAGREVRVAILDTGLSPWHQRLWNKTVASANFVEGGQPFDVPLLSDSNQNGQLDDGTGHGSMVAGIIDFVAPKTKLVVARVADSDGLSTAWRIVKGLSFAVANGAEVANISLGSVDQIKALSDVIDWTETKHLLIVSPVGNNSLDGALFPSKISRVVCVTGLASDDTKAPFSNWAGTADASAPATGVRSTWWDGSMGVWSGTSFAAPLVAGSVADALRRGPVPLGIMRGLVRSTGTDIDGLNPLYDGELGLKLQFTGLGKAVDQYLAGPTQQ